MPRTLRETRARFCHLVPVARALIHPSAKDDLGWHRGLAATKSVHIPIQRVRKIRVAHLNASMGCISRVCVVCVWLCCCWHNRGLAATKSVHIPIQRVRKIHIAHLNASMGCISRVCVVRVWLCCCCCCCCLFFFFFAFFYGLSPPSPSLTHSLTLTLTHPPSLPHEDSLTKIREDSLTKDSSYAQ